ncbi:MAG: hypothetical protein HY696_01870 [Deltaproteobacteria bacterium]|nr:hypothetical protein [Deltaproteobacteria bacterium]
MSRALDIAIHPAMQRRRTAPARLSTLLRATSTPTFTTPPAPLRLPERYITPTASRHLAAITAHRTRRATVLAVAFAPPPAASPEARIVAALKVGARYFLEQLGVRTARWEACDRILTPASDEIEMFQALIERGSEVSLEEIGGVTILVWGAAIVCRRACNEFLMTAGHEMAHLLSGVLYSYACGQDDCIVSERVVQSGIRHGHLFRGLHEGLTELIGREFVLHVLTHQPELIGFQAPPAMDGTESDFLLVNGCGYIPQARVVERIAHDAAVRFDCEPIRMLHFLFRAALQCDWSVYPLIHALYGTRLTRTIAEMTGLPASGWHCLDMITPTRSGRGPHMVPTKTDERATP